MAVIAVPGQARPDMDGGRFIGANNSFIIVYLATRSMAKRGIILRSALRASQLPLWAGEVDKITVETLLGSITLAAAALTSNPGDHVWLMTIPFLGSQQPEGAFS